MHSIVLTEEESKFEPVENRIGTAAAKKRRFLREVFLMAGKRRIGARKNERQEKRLKKSRYETEEVQTSSGKKRAKAPEYTGIFSSSTAGFGFVKPDDPDLPEFFIPGRYVSKAIDGDRVRFHEIPSRPDSGGRDKRDLGPVGAIVEILEHTRKNVVAELSSRHEARPLDKHLPESLRVNSVPKGVKPGEWVKLRLLNDGGRHTEKMTGEVVEAYGEAGTLMADLDAVCAEYNLPEPYSMQDNQEAEKIQPLDIEREDCRGFCTVTIDPADAHDFDDALSIAPGEKRGEVILGVHISDVAAFIKPGSKFDKKAAFRGFSSYIPFRFSPMLPKALTAKISLREGVDSCAHSVLFTIRKRDGHIVSFRRVHSLIHV